LQASLPQAVLQWIGALCVVVVVLCVLVLGLLLILRLLTLILRQMVGDGKAHFILGGLGLVHQLDSQLVLVITGHMDT
jgi:hypothetical protein